MQIPYYAWYREVMPATSYLALSLVILSVIAVIEGLILFATNGWRIWEWFRWERIKRRAEKNNNGRWATTNLGRPFPNIDPVVVPVSAMEAVLESNARIMEKMMERGMEATVTAMERAAFGPKLPPEETAGETGSPNKQNETPDAPPWAGWPDTLAEESDASYPEGTPTTSPYRAVGVTTLPDFTGENLDVETHG